MSTQHAARIRYFITAQKCNRYISYSSRENHILPPRRIHTQSTVTFLPTTLPKALEVHRSRTATRIVPHWSPQRIKDPSSSQIITRRFATAAGDVAKPGMTRTTALLVAAPKPEEIDPDEGVELLSPDEARLHLTERAAEKLHTISTSENDSSLALRISVESGGCHGYQYKMELTSQRAPDDYQFTHPSHRPASIVVDAVSLGLLKGSTVDYATELIGSSFSIIDNPQAKGSGCGCGVSWEAKL